jgi:hypothetical protein
MASVTNCTVVAVHYFRYLSPFQPLFLILFAIGVYKVSKLFGENGTRIFRFAATLFIIFMIPSIPYWAYIYGENCNDIFEQHRRTSWWIKDNTPKDAVIGVTDAGAIGYYSKRRIFDFVGLTIPNQAYDWRQGLGSAYERLENLPPQDIPDYIVTFPAVWGEINFLGQPVHQAPLIKNLTSMGHNLIVYRQDWSFLHNGDLPRKPPADLQLVDSLDVADIRDEHVHEYKWKEAAERPAGWEFPNTRNFFHKATHAGKLIADGGRDLSHSETFVVNLNPGKPAQIIARTESTDSSSVRLYLNGRMIDRMVAGDSRGKSWQEIYVTIPGKYIISEKNKVTVVFERNMSRTRSFHSYHYWFYQ